MSSSALIAPSHYTPAEYSNVQSVPEIWAIAAQRFGSIVALHDPHSTPEVKLTYAEVYDNAMLFAAGLQSLGIQQGDHIALFADNSPRWMITDQGIMLAGAVDAVRGSQADDAELLFILSHSDSVALVIHDWATLKKISAGLVGMPLRFIVLLTEETPEDLHGLKILTFSQVLEMGKGHVLQPAHLTLDTLATLMYTSGTSGMPKGVMLSHGNLVSQVQSTYAVVQPQPREVVLSILPIWHCYERTFEYFIFSAGCTQIYTNIRFVKKDLKEFQPNYMVGVPRLWESIYEGVQKQFRDQPASKQKLVNFFLKQSHNYIYARRTLQGLDLNNLTPSPLQKLEAALNLPHLTLLHQLGDRLVYKKVREGIGDNIKFVVSGGGSIAEHLEDFFEVAGITVLGGYGLTETSPITHVRRPQRNLRGGDGQPVPHTETKIVDPETGRVLPAGQRGLVMLRGKQVMQGYYKNPEATQKAIDPEGWFNTGDLGWVTPQGDLIITGRAKDTIVLTNGENIEPQPIEDVCLQCAYVDQIMLVGQDQKSIGALIVPNLETLQKWAESQGKTLALPNQHVPAGDSVLTLDSKPVQDLLRQELNQRIQARPGYRPDERITVFRLVTEPFTIENGLLTQTLKIRRNVVMDRYQGMINEMFL